MATTFQVKRSSVAGKVPNTSTLSVGELGLNMTDQILYSSNGIGVFELGANITNQTVKTSLLVGNSSVNTTINSSSISVSNTVFAVHFDNISDISLKDNIYDLYESFASDTINRLSPKEFTWKQTGQKSYGLIAQEVEKIIPTIVHQKPDGTKTINYIEIIAFLIQAIKEQQKQIDDIHTHINNAE